jgi:hypothetical protein
MAREVQHFHESEAVVLPGESNELMDYLRIYQQVPGGKTVIRS